MTNPYDDEILDLAANIFARAISDLPRFCSIDISDHAIHCAASNAIKAAEAFYPALIDSQIQPT